MALIVRAFPVKGTVEDVKSFASALTTERKADAAAFYRKFGISHESWHLQQTPNGPWVIGITMLDKPDESAPQFAASNETFDSWFKEQVLRITGVDQADQPLGPPTTQVFGWSDDQRPHSIPAV